MANYVAGKIDLTGSPFSNTVTSSAGLNSPINNLNNNSNNNYSNNDFEENNSYSSNQSGGSNDKTEVSANDLSNLVKALSSNPSLDPATKKSMIDEDLRLLREQSKTHMRLAWVSLLSIVLMMILLLWFVPSEKIISLASAIDWFFGTMATIVCSFMGYSGWVHKK